MADQPQRPDPRPAPAPAPDPSPGTTAPSSDPSGSAGSAGHSLDEVVATARDIVLYAPIALVLDAPTLLPKLAEQGKQHVRNARALGPHALRRIQNRLAATAGTVGEQAAEVLRQLGITPEAAGGPPAADAGTPTGSGAARPTGATGAGAASPAAGDGGRDAADSGDGSENDRGPAPPPSPAVDELAIPDYDSLSALQVVDRLPGLTADELEAVRTYEAAHRGRKTILNKAAQLQA